VGATLRDKAAQAILEVHRGRCPARFLHEDEAADAVLVVVAPLLRAEGAAAERERIRAGIEALPMPDDYNGLNAGRVWHEAMRDVLALVSREAEASDGA
jgi:hypothetical protein